MIHARDTWGQCLGRVYVSLRAAPPPQSQPQVCFILREKHVWRETLFVIMGLAALSLTGTRCTASLRRGPKARRPSIRVSIHPQAAMKMEYHQLEVPTKLGVSLFDITPRVNALVADMGVR